MAVHLDHLMVPSRDKVAAAKLLGELLGVPWSETAVGPFAAVYVDDGLTIDFDEWTDPIPLIHYCFRVDQGDFDRILERIKAAGIPYRSAVHGPVDFRVDTEHGGSIVYWNEPDGHQWEMLTVSYARHAQLYGEVLALKRAGRLIDAIKRYRELTGADLREAKAYVDRLR